MSKQKARNHYRYHYIKNGKIVHRGITKDIDRRGREHRQTHKGGWIKKIGPKVTEDSAREWEHKVGKRVLG